MTATLASLTAGDTVLFVAEVSVIDTAGFHIDLYGPDRALAGTVIIGPDGTFSGGLAAAPDTVPVTLVTGFTPVSEGDVLASDTTGETMVARAVRVDPGGSYLWSSSPDFKVAYPAAGWTIIGHVNL
jgi:hypothetical protein